MFYFVKYFNFVYHRLDWKFVHKYECKVYKDHFNELSKPLYTCHEPVSIETKSKMLLRLHLLLTNNPAKLQEKIKLQYNEAIERSFEDLINHKEKIEKNLGFTEPFFRIASCLKKCNIQLDVPTSFEHYCKIEINTFTFISEESELIGAGIFMNSSSLEHSCLPNTTLTVTGNRMEVRAIKKINIGDKICFTYFPLNKDKKQRKKLFETLFVECKCQRCEGDFDKSKM